MHDAACICACHWKPSGEESQQAKKTEDFVVVLIAIDIQNCGGYDPLDIA